MRRNEKFYFSFKFKEFREREKGWVENAWKNAAELSEFSLV